MSDGNVLPDPSTSIPLGLLSGLFYAAGSYGYAHTLGYAVFEFESPSLLYPLVLLVVAGAIPTYALVRRRTVTPWLVLAAVTTLWIDAEANPDPGPGSAFVGFLGLLPLAIGLMALLELLEYRLRERVLRTRGSA